jgi:nicotinamidase-related amidase
MVVDVQENHYPHCVRGSETLDTMVRVVEAAKVLNVPTVLTEHHPTVFGPTVEPLAQVTAGIEPLGKLHFSCFGDEAIAARISDLGVSNVVLIGTETHICICQTALMALERGLKTAVVADAVTARKARDHDVALSRLRAHGVDVLTWESLVYEWMKRGGTDDFRKILPIVKRH